MLSGNRNFEGRIHPSLRANYLASPLLVIAYALAGTVLIDFEAEPIGKIVLIFYLYEVKRRSSTKHDSKAGNTCNLLLEYARDRCL